MIQADRRNARILALQALYEVDVSRHEGGNALAALLAEEAHSEESASYARVLVSGVRDNVERIDALIAETATSWPIDQLSVVDRNILRLAVYELLYGQGIPPKVALNEAIDLGKEFGSENSGSFINGILDALYSKLLKDNADPRDHGKPGPAPA